MRKMQAALRAGPQSTAYETDLNAAKFGSKANAELYAHEIAVLFRFEQRNIDVEGLMAALRRTFNCSELSQILSDIRSFGLIRKTLESTGPSGETLPIINILTTFIHPAPILQESTLPVLKRPA